MVVFLELKQTTRGITKVSKMKSPAVFVDEDSEDPNSARTNVCLDSAAKDNHDEDESKNEEKYAKNLEEIGHDATPMWHKYEHLSECARKRKCGLRS